MDRLSSSFDLNQMLRELLDSAGLSSQTATVIAASGAVLFMMLLLTIRLSRRARMYGARFERARSVVRQVQPEKGLENNLESFLELFESLVEAPVYSFYVYDDKSRHFVLKAVRHNARDFGKVRPSYSGLADYKKEEYHPPLSLVTDTEGKKVQLVIEGEVPMLSVMTGSGNGMVRIGPTKKKMKRKVRKALEELGELIGHSLNSLIVTEQLTSKADVVVASGRAIQQINEIAMHPNETVELLTKISMQTIGATGGCYIERHEDAYIVPFQAGISDRVVQSLVLDRETLRMLDELLIETGVQFIARDDEMFRRLPDYATSGQTQAIAAIRAGSSRHFLLFWFDRFADAEAEQTARSTIRLIHDDIKRITPLQFALRQLSGTYAGILKGHAQMLDNLSPYTIGYSELMSRYSIVIAKELGLDDALIADIALAAYLSNIGMLGITSDLYQKEGKYTEQEFEMMKLHCEVGASIVRTTIGNERVADLILYHHERMDGNGYPHGLKGNEIPIGSRIIAVVQTFLAKINGRKYRDPLPFHKALQTLRSASGSQLDGVVVDKFIGWFEKKQRNPQFSARSIGPCWEMCCTPESICEQCPAYQRTDMNCWEVDGNNCKSHGKSCATCFVRTEYVHRTESKRA